MIWRIINRPRQITPSDICVILQIIGEPNTTIISFIQAVVRLVLPRKTCLNVLPISTGPPKQRNLVPAASRLTSLFLAIILFCWRHFLGDELLGDLSLSVEWKINCFYLPWNAILSINWCKIINLSWKATTATSNYWITPIIGLKATAQEGHAYKTPHPVQTGQHHILLQRPIKTYYCSFNIFSQFWLAKSTRIIHHNQLLMTKFGRIMCLMWKWRQKCSPLLVKATLPRRTRDEIELFWLWKKNGGHFTRFKSKNYSWN